jgi:isoleucyl-tRNA synthetase
VNVKELKFIEGSTMLVKKVKCNFRVMGKKFGKLMKAVSNAVDGMTQEQIAQLERDGQITLQADGQDALIERADVDIISEDIPGWTVMNDGTLTVALDITITPELKNEGVAREIVKRIQGLRKDSGFEITDRISVKVSDNPAVRAAVDAFNDYISSQVLANSISIEDNDGQEFDFDEFKVNIKVTKD